MHLLENKTYAFVLKLNKMLFTFQFILALHIFDPSKPRLDRPFFLITVFEGDAIAASG